MASLTIAPHPLKAGEVATLLDLPEHDVGLALALLGHAGRVTVKDDRWTIVPTADVLAEAVSAVRQSHRERWVARWDERLKRALAPLDIGAQPATIGA